LEEMKINDSKVSEIVDQHDTPLYVYDEHKIREQYRELEESLCSRYDDVQINYAVKSNFNPRIAEILLDEGAGLDCASKAELELADRLDADEVMYTAPYNRKDELEYAVEKGAEVNLDSVFLLDKMTEVPEMICFRIDPEIDSDRDLMFAGGDAKFGVSEEKAVEAYRKAKGMGVEKFGIHMMTGSNVTDASYFEYITERLLKVAERISKELVLSLSLWI
jgi:Diaminopimelate decarboxylase